MHKLSSKAWNNVIIFAMLFMVYLFSMSNNLIIENENRDKVRLLLPEHSVIMQIHFAEVSLERIGRSWRSKGSKQWSIDQLSALVTAWGKLTVHEIPFHNIAHPYVVTLLVAGEEKRRIFQLLERPDGVQINQAGRSYFTSHAKIGDLITL